MNKKVHNCFTIEQTPSQETKDWTVLDNYFYLSDFAGNKCSSETDGDDF